MRHHGTDSRYVCSGTKQLRAVMALHQCNLFRGRRLAESLRRSAELIRSSVGPLSCTRRLRVDRENVLLLTGSGPSSVNTDVKSGALKTMWPVVEDFARSPDTLACKIRFV